MDYKFAWINGRLALSEYNSETHHVDLIKALGYLRSTTYDVGDMALGIYFTHDHSIDILYLHGNPPGNEQLIAAIQSKLRQEGYLAHKYRTPTKQ